MRTSVLSVLCSALATASLSLSPALAQDATGQLQVELNVATPLEAGGCSLTYVVTNQSELSLADSAYYVGIFDAGGVVRGLMNFGFGALPPGKTRVVQFGLPGQECADISRVVLDRPIACVLDDGTESDFCMTGLVTASRTDIRFGI